jgi:Na+/melibiose symporter-like transporter
VTVVVTALPRMLADLGATPAEGTAVVTAYAMFFGGLLIVAARVGDRVGHRRVVLAALALFAAASALGALAESVWLLATARAFQGVAAATSVPSALRLLTTVVPDGPARRRAVAGWSAAGAAAGASGFVVGGVLTELASWRAVFWMNIALAVLLAAAIVHLIPRDQPSPAVAGIGWPSAILLTGAAMGIVAGTTLLGEHESAVLAGAVTTLGVLAAAGFAPVERRASHPLIRPAARRAPVLRWGAFGSFFNTATTSSSITVATLYLQDRLGLTPLRAAALLVTFSILVVGGSLGAPRLITALGWSRAVGCGLSIIAAGNTLLVAWPHVIGVGVAAGICGLGIGIGSGRRDRHGHRRRRSDQGHRCGSAQHRRPARHCHRNVADPARRDDTPAPPCMGGRSVPGHSRRTGARPTRPVDPADRSPRRGHQILTVTSQELDPRARPTLATTTR